MSVGDEVEPRPIPRGLDARAALERARAHVSGAAPQQGSPALDTPVVETVAAARREGWAGQAERAYLGDLAGRDMGMFARAERAIAERFIDSCRDRTRARILLLVGPTGVGKTSLALAVGERLAVHLSPTVIVSHNRWLDELLPEGSDRPRRAVAEVPRRAGLLLVDDFGAEREATRPGQDAVSAAARRATVDLLDARAHGGMVTLVTTNLTSAVLGQVWGERALSRLAGNDTVVLKVSGVSGADRRNPQRWG